MPTTPFSPLYSAQLFEQSGFTHSDATSLNPSFEALIALELANLAEATNESASVIVTIKEIKGTAKVGSISDGIEAYGYYISGRKKSVVGENGQLLSSGHVVLWDLCVIFPDNAFVESSIQEVFTGKNVGDVKLTYMRNAGKTAQPAFEIELTNARISALRETESTTAMSFGFDSIKITYLPEGDDATAAGKVAAGFDLTEDKEKK